MRVASSARSYGRVLTGFLLISSLCPFYEVGFYCNSFFKGVAVNRNIVLLVFLLVASSNTQAPATIITTSDFLAINGGEFGGWPSGISDRLHPVTIGSVTFSFSNAANTQHSIGSSFSFTVGGGSDPSTRHYFGRPFSGSPETVIDFSEPLSAFGVTFHMDDAELQVFDGPGGTGMLLGSIVGTPPGPPWGTTNRPVDFVAVISDQQNIRSAKVVGFTDATEYGVSGIGFSLPLTVPEPSTFALGILGLFGLILAGGYRLRRM